MLVCFGLVNKKQKKKKKSGRLMRSLSLMMNKMRFTALIKVFIICNQTDWNEVPARQMLAGRLNWLCRSYALFSFRKCNKGGLAGEVGERCQETNITEGSAHEAPRINASDGEKEETHWEQREGPDGTVTRSLLLWESWLVQILYQTIRPVRGLPLLLAYQSWDRSLPLEQGRSTGSGWLDVITRCLVAWNKVH